MTSECRIAGAEIHSVTTGFHKSGSPAASETTTYAHVSQRSAARCGRSLTTAQDADDATKLEKRIGEAVNTLGGIGARASRINILSEASKWPV